MLVVSMTLISALPSHAAVEAFLQFVGDSNVSTGDSQDTVYKGSQGWFVVKSLNFGATQTLSIGSQTTGTGAGKVAFAPLILQKQVNSLSPTVFQNLAAGKSYQFVNLVLRNSNSTNSIPNPPFMKVTFKLVGADSLNWTMPAGATELSELVGFEYGAMVITYTPINADGTAGTPVIGGWNRVRNVVDGNPTTAIQ